MLLGIDNQCEKQDNGAPSPSIIFHFPWPETFEQHEKRCAAVRQATTIEFMEKLISHLADPIDLFIDTVNFYISTAFTRFDLKFVEDDGAYEEDVDKYLTPLEESLFQRLLLFEMGRIYTEKIFSIEKHNTTTTAKNLSNMKDLVHQFSAETEKLRQRTNEILEKRHAKGFLSDDAYNSLRIQLNILLKKLDNFENWELPEGN